MRWACRVEDELAATRRSTTSTPSAGRTWRARWSRAGHAASVDDAFDRYLELGQPAYVPRQGIGPARGDRGHPRPPAACPVLAHSPAAPDRPDVIDELHGLGPGRPRGLLPDVPARDGRSAWRAFAAERGLLATGGSDYHGDTMDYAEAQATTWVPDAVGEPRLLEALGPVSARSAARPGHAPSRGRRRPAGSTSCPLGSRGASRARGGAGVAEFVTDDVVLPRFHVWTLGCQMNRSDSEEMAGCAAGGRLRRGALARGRPT